MYTIYHNPRCKKSREGLELLKNANKEFTIREYLKEPLSRQEIEDLLEKLNIIPIQLIRTNESIWKENYKDKDLNDDELIRILSENPKLIERPVVATKKEAVIGRPPALIEKLL